MSLEKALRYVRGDAVPSEVLEADVSRYILICVAALLGVLIVLLATFVSGRVGPGVVSQHASRLFSAESDSNPAGAAADDDSGQRRPVTLPARITFMNSSGERVPGVQVEIRSPNSAKVVWSNQEGWVEVPTDPPSLLRASHKDYLSRQMATPEESRIVTLVRPSAIAVTCVDLRGAPVRGLQVVASRVVLPATLQGVDENLIKASNAATAYTNADGQAMLRRMVEGRYHIRVYGEGVVPLEVLGSTIEIDAERTERISITVARVLIAAARIVGDKPVAPVYYRPEFASRDYGATLAVQEIQRKVLGRFPDCIALAFPEGKHYNRDAHSSATVSVLCARSGWQQLTLPLDRWGPGFEPKMVDLSGLPADESLCRLRVDLVDAGERVVDWPVEVFSVRGGDLQSFLRHENKTGVASLPYVAYLESGESAMLPAGRAELRLENMIVSSTQRSSMSAELEEAGDRAIRFVIDEYLCFVELELLDRDHGVPVLGTVMFHAADGRRILGSRRGRASAQIAMLVAQGRYSVRCEADGYETLTSDLEIVGDRLSKVLLLGRRR